MSIESATGSGKGSEVVHELAIQREMWCAKLMPVAAMLSTVGLVAMALIDPPGQHVLPLLGFALVFLACVLPGLPLRLRAWAVGIGMPSICLLSIFEFGLTPNLFCGLLLTLICARLLFDFHGSTAVAAFVALGLLVLGLSLALSPERAAPSWTSTLDPTRPSNVIRVLVVFAVEGASAMLALGYVLKNMETLLRDKAVAMESLRAESAAKEVLRDRLAKREKADIRARELQQLGRLASFFGHDTNNALQIIWSSLDVLRAPETTAAQRRDALAMLQTSASQIRTISMQLRAFGPGRSQTGGSADLDHVLGTTVRMLTHVFPKEIEIALESKALATVSIAESELQRMLINLAMNARDAMERGGRLTVRSHFSDPEGAPVAPSSSHVAIELEDTGVGIAEDVQSRLFEPFFTTKGEHGTGLGLASVRESVQACGGSVKLRSQRGEGTAVMLVLPVAAGPAA